jgi:hypothetical protein
VVEGDESVVSAVWNQQSVWSQAADRMKRGIFRARTVSLLSGIVAAVCATAASQAAGSPARGLAFLSAVGAGLAPMAGLRAGPGLLRDWVRLRSVSEALKSEVYQFLAGVGPYRAGDARLLLLEQVRQITGGAQDLVHHTLGIVPADRAVPRVTDAASYAEFRLRSQIERYYQPKAEEMRRRSAVVRGVELALGVAGVVLGAASASLGTTGLERWVAVTVTVSAAVMTHAAASRYDYQQLEFSRTAAELRFLHSRWAAARERTPESDDAFVARCEHVISVQNEGWMAKWSEDAQDGVSRTGDAR